MRYDAIQILLASFSLLWSKNKEEQKRTNKEQSMGRRLNPLLVTITWRKLKQTAKVLMQLGPVTRSGSLRTIFCSHPDLFCNIW